ncbi:hypothetical protein B0G77_8234 [Paraburkholderia sp. BL10I2N1]|nr:hypothetical protein B0G77_8234 [Paraburkholderia sp. BL10I2N1]
MYQYARPGMADEIKMAGDGQRTCNAVFPAADPDRNDGV